MNAGPENASDNRPSKRQRGHSSAASRSRGQTACAKCRERKTKCDNARPSCGYCVQHQVTCFYADDTILDIRQDIGYQILHAIEELSWTVTSRLSSDPAHDSATPQERPPDVETRRVVRDGTHGIATPSTINENSSRPAFGAQGIDGILKWPILADLRTGASLYGKQHTYRLTDTLPEMGYAELIRLANIYVATVHVMNPILDLTQLDTLLREFSEFGLDWSVRTCLVSLVCAIGSASEETSVNGHTRSDTMGPVSKTSHQFWSIAAKRIGLLMGDHSIEAIQCLCLAGIYALNRMQVITAWKYFSTAGTSWAALNLIQTHAPQASRRESLASFTTMESLYFTIWKSECEILVEVNLPGPLLDRAGFASDFPCPPLPAVESPQPVLAEEQRIWFYYLAEIAARHLINRIIRWPVSALVARTNADLQAMIDRADFFDDQIDDWYSSLPPFLQQGIPKTMNRPQQTDSPCMVLRHRYWSARELIRRPFVELCVEHSPWMDAALSVRIVKFASEHVQYCLLKAPDIPQHVHQGSWTGLQTIVICILTWTALELARKRSPNSLAHDVELPENWLNVAHEAMRNQELSWQVAPSETHALHSLATAALSAVEQ